MCGGVHQLYFRVCVTTLLTCFEFHCVQADKVSVQFANYADRGGSSLEVLGCG